MTTATVPMKAAQLAAELESLLGIAAEYAGLEDRLERKARKIESSDWQFADDAPSHYLTAVEAQVSRALAASTGESGSVLDALDVCQHIQDALDVLKFAMERDDAR